MTERFIFFKEENTGIFRNYIPQKFIVIVGVDF